MFFKRSSNKDKKKKLGKKAIILTTTITTFIVTHLVVIIVCMFAGVIACVSAAAVIIYLNDEKQANERDLNTYIWDEVSSKFAEDNKFLVDVNGNYLYDGFAIIQRSSTGKCYLYYFDEKGAGTLKDLTYHDKNDYKIVHTAETEADIRRIYSEQVDDNLIEHRKARIYNVIIDTLAEVGENISATMEQINAALNGGMSGQAVLLIDDSKRSPQPLDWAEGENNCSCKKEVVNNTLKRDSTLPWQFSTWTVSDSSSNWDVNYDKFTKTDGNGANDYLYSSNINNYGTSKQVITNELTRNYSYIKNKGTYEVGKVYTDIEYDNSSYTNAGVSTSPADIAWMYIGENTFVAVTDGRICTAIPYMALCKNWEELRSARTKFHKMLNADGSNVWKLWGGDDFNNASFAEGRFQNVPRSTWVDVCFENNTTKKQVVIPFIYTDAKAMHLKGGVAMLVDQRYGQTNASVCMEQYTTPEGVPMQRLIDSSIDPTSLKQNALELFVLGEKFNQQTMNLLLGGNSSLQNWSLISMRVYGDKFESEAYKSGGTKTVLCMGKAGNTHAFEESIKSVPTSSIPDSNKVVTYTYDSECKDGICRNLGDR